MKIIECQRIKIEGEGEDTGKRIEEDDGEEGEREKPESDSF